MFSGGFLSGGFLARGVFVQGFFVRGFMSGGFLSGGFCPDTIQNFEADIWRAKVKNPCADLNDA